VTAPNDVAIGALTRLTPEQDRSLMTAAPEAHPMAKDLRRRIVGLYGDYAEGRFSPVLDACDDDVDFLSYAPRDVFPYLGHRRGKSALAATFQAARMRFEYVSLQPVSVVIEDDNAAVILLSRQRQRATGRVIQLFRAQFLRFRAGRVVRIRDFLDSFDAVQQVLGREIDLPPSPRLFG
jgi:ketosteroid isomerase-like protein